MGKGGVRQGGARVGQRGREREEIKEESWDGERGGRENVQANIWVTHMRVNSDKQGSPRVTSL